MLHNLVGSGAEEAGHGLALSHGHRVLGLVPIAQTAGSAQNGNFFQILSRQAVQTVPDTLGLQPQLLVIVHVPEVTAAAQLCRGAFPVDPVGRTLQNFRQLSGGPGLPGLLNAHPNPFPCDGIGDEHGAAVNFGHTHALGGVVGDDGLVNMVLFHHRKRSKHNFAYSIPHSAPGVKPVAFGKKNFSQGEDKGGRMW